MSRRYLPEVVAAGLATAAVLVIAWHAGVKEAGVAPEVLRGGAALLALLVAAGYAPARLLAPRELHVYLPLLVPLVGAMTAGLVLSALGFVGVPLAVSVAIVVAAGVVAGLVVRLRLGPARPAPTELAAAGGRWLTLAVPVYIAVLLAGTMLIPVMREQLVSVPGLNPDAMLGTGTMELLRNAGPQEVRPELPVDRMPREWKSKYPVYYVMAGAAELAGLSSLELWAAASAVLAGLTALGFFLLARCSLRAGPRAALLAMGLVAADRVLAHLTLHPYHNQLWGALTLAPMLLFGLRFIDAPNRRDGALASLFLVVGLLAYPLMVVFPAAAFGAAWLLVRRKRGGALLPRPRLPRRRGLRIMVAVAALPALVIALNAPVTVLFAAAISYACVLAWRERGLASRLRARLPSRHRGAWVVLAAAVLPAALVLFLAALAKVLAVRTLLDGDTLMGWRGDLTAYHGFAWLAGVENVVGFAAGVAIFVLALIGLRRAPRNVRIALGATVVVVSLAATYFRLRTFGEYFHFKLVAFLFPLLLVAAGSWLAERAGPDASSSSSSGRLAAAAATVLLFVVLLLGLDREIRGNELQAGRPTLELRAAAARILPPGASVRIDAEDGHQLWAGYMLADHPVTAIEPIVNTSYPSPPQGRKADFIVAEVRLKPRGPWPDAAGPPLYENELFRLYRMRDDVPGRDRASQRFTYSDDLSEARARAPRARRPRSSRR